MPTFLQPVTIPERCFLHEVLLWVAFQRLPVATYGLDGHEIRNTTEIGGYVAEVTDEEIHDDECQRAGIPVDPRFTELTTETPTSLKLYQDLLTKYDHDEARRRTLEAERDQAEQFERDYTAWQPHYARVIEFPASQIFVALKGGRLRATGRMLPAVDYEEAMAKLDDSDIFDVPTKDIESAFWTLQGIDFESSAARNDVAHYCHISCRTEDVLSLFPGERESVTVERVGDSYILGETTRQVARAANRGRPPYPWERFHLEVAASIAQNDLPGKKEAAIQHFQSWFAREVGVRPSRAAIGEKLTPYYDRFVRRDGQKF